jgi:uncharacterized membrane protein YoaK (UPF0700 family)
MRSQVLPWRFSCLSPIQTFRPYRLVGLNPGTFERMTTLLLLVVAIAVIVLAVRLRQRRQRRRAKIVKLVALLVLAIALFYIVKHSPLVSP